MLKNILTNKSRMNEGNTKLPLGKHDSNRCRQYPPMDVKISGERFEKKWDIYVAPRVSLPNIYH